jgi:hypothetical protein
MNNEGALIKIDGDKIELLSLLAKIYTNTAAEALSLLILATKHLSDQYKQEHIAPEDQSGLISIFIDVVTKSYQGSKDTQGTA